MDDEMRQFMATINNKLDNILDRQLRNRDDIENTRGHIVYTLENSIMLGKRITKLENEIRRARRDGPPSAT